jgi:hypothetical protein
MKRSFFFLLFAFSLPLIFILPSQAQSNGSPGNSAIDRLETDVNKVQGIYDNIVPVAVGSTVFGIGAILIKRIAFS